MTLNTKPRQLKWLDALSDHLTLNIYIKPAESLPSRNTWFQTDDAAFHQASCTYIGCHIGSVTRHQDKSHGVGFWIWQVKLIWSGNLVTQRSTCKRIILFSLKHGLLSLCVLGHAQLSANLCASSASIFITLYVLWASSKAIKRKRERERELPSLECPHLRSRAGDWLPLGVTRLEVAKPDTWDHSSRTIFAVPIINKNIWHFQNWASQKQNNFTTLEF